MFNPNFDPEEALPPAEVRITELSVEPWPDGRRVKVLTDITPFQKNPNIDALIVDSQGTEIASITIIESMEARLVFTMHLRRPDPSGKYSLRLSLRYDDFGVVDERSLDFEVQPVPDTDA